MSRPTTPTVDAPTADSAAREGIERLQQILTRVDAFLAEWWERYENPVNAIPDVSIPAVPPPNDLSAGLPEQSTTPTDATKASLAQRIAQFETEKRRWQSHRDSEAQRLAEKFDQLAKGWLHLEAERRTLLQTQQAQRSRRATAPPEVVVGGPATDVAAHAPPPLATPALTAQSQPNHVPASAPSGGAADAAVQQFQQLRRQIESRREPRDQP